MHSVWFSFNLMMPSTDLMLFPKAAILITAGTLRTLLLSVCYVWILPDEHCLHYTNSLLSGRTLSLSCHRITGGYIHTQGKSKIL